MSNIDQLRALESAATPGPWEADGRDRAIRRVGPHLPLAYDVNQEDGEFIAAMRNALPWLLDTLEVREATRSDLRQQWEAGHEAGIRNADHRLRLALDILDGRFRPADRIGDLHGAMKRALRGEL